MKHATVKNIRNMNCYNVRIKDTDSGEIIENATVDEVRHFDDGVLETSVIYHDETVKQRYSDVSKVVIM